MAVLSFVAGSLSGNKNDVEFYTKFHAECQKLLKDSKNESDKAAEYYERADKRYKEAKELLETLARRRSKQADFNKALSALRDTLEGGRASEMELRHEWERVQVLQEPQSAASSMPATADLK